VCCNLPCIIEFPQETIPMRVRQLPLSAVLACTLLVATTSVANGQAGETFTATATVKTAGGASATAPVTISVDRTMPQAEADGLAAAFKSGGVSGLRKALKGTKPTGSVTLGSGKPTPTRITIERATDKGRLLTIVSDTPILFLGAGVPEAKAKAGYDFAVVDIELDAKGSGAGTLAPAAKIILKNGAFVVEDFASELVQLTAVSKK
jgi:hypothetical protein